jgi:tricorn protease
MRAGQAFGAVGVAVAGLAAATAGSELGYYSQPALHGDRLVFVSEGDLWTARLPDGSEDGPIIAHRLTSGAGTESRPCFSPSGDRIAFAGQYDGNVDVYTMAADGGAPRRLTFHPDPDVPLGWSPQGRNVLLRSPRSSPLGRSELFEVSAAGGMPSRFGFGECTMIATSPTGRRFAFTRWSTETWSWKRYRGGTAPEIWVGDFDSTRFRQLTDDRANDQFPMWVAGRVFFLSDRTGTANIFSDTPEGGDLRQHTRFAPVDGNPQAPEGYDVRWPSADAARRGRRIVFCQGAGLALLSVDDDSVRRLDVRLASDRVARRQRFAPPMASATGFGLSRDGTRVLIESRGEVLVLPVEGGAATQLPRRGGSREHGATFIDDARLMLVTDAGGEQQLATVPADGSGEMALATTDREAWLFPPAVSPDADLVAFGDKTLRLHVLDMRTLDRRQADMSEAGEITDYRFSPDSQWLAYTVPMPGDRSVVRLYSVRTQRTFTVSDGLHSDREPRWDPAGRYLYMLSRRHFNPVMDEQDYEHVTVGTTRVVAVPLAEQTPPPIPAVARAAGVDLEAWAAPAAEAAQPDEPAGDDGAGAADPAAPADAIAVDTDGLDRRHVLLPIDAGRLEALEAVRGGVLLLERPETGLLDLEWPPPALGGGDGTLVRHHLAEPKRSVVAEGLSRYALSADATTVAWVADGTVRVLPLAGDAAKTVDPGTARLRVDVPAEWRHIFEEAWRLQRDFYWAANLAGVDWPAMKLKYGALLDRVGTRAELNDLVGEMIGELGTSHAYVWGGEAREEPTPVPVGLLGADLEYDGRGFRIRRIVPGRAWGDRFRSPLDLAHLDVAVDDVIVAVNGVAVTPASNLHDLLQDQAGRPVRLTLAGEGAGTRPITVEPVGSERLIRYAAWVEANRRAVADRSDGRIGYLHVPDMGGDGLSMFTRYFYPQHDLPALVVDVRGNGGGFVSQMVLERLARKLLAFAAPRHGASQRYPARAADAHLVVLIDQHAGSDGDIFPAAFRMLGLGPLIGTRTWGGVVGIRGDKPFVDMGLSTQPEYAWWDAERGWSIENEGVEPDVEVAITPGDRASGRDPQLQRAVELLLQELAVDPKQLPPLPAYPVR